MTAMLLHPHPFPLPSREREYGGISPLKGEGIWRRNLSPQGRGDWGVGSLPSRERAVLT